ncbi:hypothetical protein R1sor_015569 [Riccia sorocarpa]|uniref:Uncharacterized protein n=1 Tax=Riccia sorocarpa TaxID=122646 RepID=A0ABD3HFY0_9MARC
MKTRTTPTAIHRPSWQSWPKTGLSPRTVSDFPANVQASARRTRLSKIEFARENIERSGGSCRPYKTGRDICLVS